MSSWNAAALAGVFATEVEQDVNETSTRLRTLSQMADFVGRCEFARFIAISLANPATRASHRSRPEGDLQW
jgi:hypothetical protein